MIAFDRNTKIRCDEGDYKGVLRVAEWIREDLHKVFGDPDGGAGTVIIAGTAGKSTLLEELHEKGLLSDEGLKDSAGNPKWEVYRTDRVRLDGAETVVIQGSDKRGTIYGLLAVSEACGVSPFVNWSEATPKRTCS